MAIDNNTYDSTVLQRYADRLYRRAVWVIVKYLLLGAALGSVIGYSPTILWYWRSPSSPAPNDSGLLIFTVLIGALVFAAIGEAKAFMYKLQAQTVLCQMQIEKNTRRLA